MRIIPLKKELLFKTIYDMNQFTETQKKIFLYAGIFDLLAAVIILGIAIGRENSNFPLVIPILLLIPGIILIWMGVKK